MTWLTGLLLGWILGWVARGILEYIDERGRRKEQHEVVAAVAAANEYVRASTAVILADAPPVFREYVERGRIQ